MDFIYCLIPVILLALFVLFSGGMLYSRARVVFTMGKFSNIANRLDLHLPIFQSMARWTSASRPPRCRAGNHHQGYFPSGNAEVYLRSQSKAHHLIADYIFASAVYQGRARRDRQQR